MISIYRQCVFVLLVLTWNLPSLAQTFPTKPVKIVVATTAGGLADTLVRSIASELAKAWGQPVIVENRPGAATILGATYVARSAPDGYTILLANDPTLSSNQYAYSKLTYDPVKDFSPVLNIVDIDVVLIAKKTFFPKTVAELVRAAKENPGGVTYGSFGIGSKAHIDFETLSKMTGVKLSHIPYKGVSEVLTALISDQIDVGIAGIPPAMPYLQSHKIKAIGIASSKRSPLLPDVPTFAEQGVAGFESRTWLGFVVPTGTPKAVIDKISADTARITSRSDFREKHIDGAGLNLLNQGPAQFEEFLKSDRAQYKVRVQNANVRPE